MKHGKWLLVKQTAIITFYWKMCINCGGKIKNSVAADIV